MKPHRRKKAQHDKDNLLSHSDDLYCFAATVLDMHAGSPLWRAGNCISDLIKQDGSFAAVPLRVDMSNDVVSVIQQCFVANPVITAWQVEKDLNLRGCVLYYKMMR